MGKYFFVKFHINQKFSDQQLLDLHAQGLSDIKIARIFKVSHSTIAGRRAKLGLIANFSNPFGKRRNLVELEKAHQKKIDKLRVKIHSLKPSTKKQSLLQSRRWVKNHPEESKKYSRESYWKHREKRLEYCQRNREKIRERIKKWKEKNREYYRNHQKRYRQRKKLEKLSLGSAEIRIRRR